jgi:hypothetical protein
LINLAIALSFVVAVIFWPGGRALQLLIELPVLHSLPQYQAHLLLAFANYCIPAVLFYVLLRLTRAGEWLRSRGWIQFLLGAANILFILYVSAKIVASEVEGGGASFVVVSFAPFVLLPAIAMALAGLTWLTVRSVRMRSLPPQSAATPLNRRTATALVATLVIPGAALVFPMFVARDAPFRLAAEARAMMQEQCSRSGEVILGSAPDVQSLYLEPNGAASFREIVDGRYRAWGSGELGQSFVNLGLLQYFERKNDRGPGTYRRHTRSDRRGEPVDEISSIYGVIQESLLPRDVEQRLQLQGTRVTVKNLKTDEVIGTLTYFVSKGGKRICGHSGGDRLEVREFIRRTLNLRKAPGTP